MSRGPMPPGQPPGPLQDDAGCTVLHVDMDAFYAGVELRRRPELRNRPMLVGGGGGRGVVLSASYPARRYGIRSAMPVMRARRLCPDLVVVPPDFVTYSAVSDGVMEIFRSVTPRVEPLSMDEAFLDVVGAARGFGSPRQIGQWLRARVADEQGITCSVGVASTKFVAKLASARCKPDGLQVVARDRVVQFLHPLPVAALWGVGEKTEQLLVRLGLHTVGDIAHTPVATLQKALGPAAGRHLAELSWGRDSRRVLAAAPERSIGAENTFGRDTDDPGVVRRELLRLSERTASRLRATRQVGLTVTLKVRFADYTTITRSRTLPEATDTGRTVYATVCALHERLGLQRARVRLVGVRMEGLRDADTSTHQLRLGEPAQGWREAEQAVDRAVRRFGPGTVRPAVLVGPGARPSAGADGPANPIGGSPAAGADGPANPIGRSPAATSSVGDRLRLHRSGNSAFMPGV